MMDRIEDVNTPKTLESWIPDEVVLASLGSISGILSTVPYLIGGATVHPRFWVAGLFLAPGAWFAVAAMLPFRGLVAYWWPRTLLAIAACAGVHAVAFTLVTAPLWGGAASPGRLGLPWLMSIGGLGALISGKGLLVLLGRPWRYRILAFMVAAGAIGMVSFRLFFFIYPIWQAAVAAPLGSLRRELKAEEAERKGTTS